MSYQDFLEHKAQQGSLSGFEPTYLPDFLFDFQEALVDWTVRKGRSAIFADCGLGKTPMFLVWAENVVRHTNRPVLILTPLAVSFQTIAEAEKFGIEAHRTIDGKVWPGINVTNYERLHHFNPADFAAVVCDESSILKSFDGARKAEITEFMRRVEYRLLDTATAAPNDYIELGTPKIGCLGLNLQSCAHMTSFPSHSFEQYYQGVRRCWRFGQTRPVTVDIVTTEGEKSVLANLQRKAKAADRMFTELVAHMNDALRDRRPDSLCKARIGAEAQCVSEMGGRETDQSGEGRRGDRRHDRDHRNAAGGRSGDRPANRLARMTGERRARRPILGRGFDTRLSRGFDGKVRPR